MAGYRLFPDTGVIGQNFKQVIVAFHAPLFRVDKIPHTLTGSCLTSEINGIAGRRNQPDLPLVPDWRGLTLEQECCALPCRLTCSQGVIC